MNILPDDASPCASLLLDPACCLVTASAALGRMTGRDVGTVSGLPFEDLLTPAGAAMFQGYVLPALMLHGAIEEFALSLRHARGGATFDVLLYAALVPAPAGGEGIHMVLAPYRARRAVDDELVRVKRAADMAPTMIFQLRCLPDGRLEMPYASEAVQALYGCTPMQARASARRVLDRLHPDDVPAFAAHPPGVDEARHRFDVRVLRPGAEPARHEVHAASRRLPDGTVVWHGHIADVTEHRRLAEEAASLRAAEQVRHAQTTFLGRVSHELRTPLNAILGFSQLLAQAPVRGDPALVEHHVDLIRGAGEHLLGLVDDLLDIARLQGEGFAVQAEPIDLVPLLRRSIALCGAEAGRAGVAVDGPDVASAWVMGEARRLAQVVDNLLSNALKYNRPGGRVRVSVLPRDDEVVVGVEDTGWGMTAAQRSQLFQPFNRLGVESTGVRGSGLGLVIAAQIVELLGGRIDCTSVPGAGTCFSVTLRSAHPLTAASTEPLPDAAAQAAAAMPTGAQAPTPSRLAGVATGPRPPAEQPLKRVLYVEDDPVNAILLRALADQVPGIRLEVAGCGLDGLEMALADPPALMLLDRHLPDIEGVALLGRMREHPTLRAIPAVMVSAAAQPEVAAAALAAGFEAFWTKPINVAAMQARLASLAEMPAPPHATPSAA